MTQTLQPTKKNEKCLCCEWLRETDEKHGKTRKHRVRNLVIFPILTPIKKEPFVGCEFCDGGLVERVIKKHGS